MIVTCPNCKKEYVPALANEENFDMRLDKWRAGALIQNAFSRATPTEREQLLTGICSDKCWDKYIGGEE